MLFHCLKFFQPFDTIQSDYRAKTSSCSSSIVKKQEYCIVLYTHVTDGYFLLSTNCTIPIYTDVDVYLTHERLLNVGTTIQIIRLISSVSVNVSVSSI